MNKIFKIFGVVALVYALLWGAGAGVYAYAQTKWETTQVEQQSYGVNTLTKKGFASTYHWSTTATEAEIVIPDAVNGYTITELGGYDGKEVSPFTVELSLYGDATLADAVPEDAQIEQYHLTLHIGKKIKAVNSVTMFSYYKLSEQQFVQILVSIECDEENPYFYSQDGKLYQRADNTLVEGFFYYSDFVKIN